MSRILIFEDQPIERKDIEKIVREVLSNCKSDIKIEKPLESIRDITKVAITPENPIHLIITDILNSKKDLVGYMDLLAQARDSQNADEKVQFIEQANEILINAAKYSLKHIASEWGRISCPLIIITKINRSNLMKILEGLNSDLNILRMFDNKIDVMIRKIKRRSRTMYKSKNLTIFLKKEYYECASDEVFAYEEAHSSFNKWFSKKLMNMLRISNASEVSIDDEKS
ncbi:MAG: hypothetical protein FWD44_00080 [Oscillospiraceae bacterium]|nr:hypothetical protein [Oscillospiraceae bacterium]